VPWLVNNLNIKKSLDNADNTKTNLITNAGTLHANNNIILATTLSNTKGDITASKDLNITSNDITTTEGKISANNTNITTNNLDSTDTNILAVNNLNLNIANLLTNKGKIQANQTLTLNAKTLDNQQNIVANSINLTISTKTTNTGKIQTTQDLNLATNELDNQANANIIAGNNLNIKKSLDNADNTKTNLITNAGTLHANNNIILATTV
jgi:filamentous hemagglutinin